MNQRTMLRLWIWMGAAVIAICYGAYQANPMLAIGCGVGIAAIFGLGALVSRYQEKRVKQMVADVEAGADRYIAGGDQ